MEWGYGILQDILDMSFITAYISRDYILCTEGNIRDNFSYTVIWMFGR